MRDTQDTHTRFEMPLMAALQLLWLLTAQREEEELHLDDLHATEESLKRKLQTVRELHEKLIEFIPEDDLEAIEEEVIEQEEYAHSLKIKLQQVRSCIQICVANININANQGSSASVDQTPLNAHTTSNIPHIPDRSNFHRLPKLDLPKFTGNLLDWQAFWDSYESAIHENASLSNVQKFNYLKSSLREDALQTVTGFSLTNANYEKAVSLLHERYGRKEKLIQTYMMTLFEVPAPVYTCVSLREFYDKTEIYIRGLNSLGQDASCYGSLLVPIILQKLPEDIRRNITRAHGTSWTLGDLMRHLRDEINILDAGCSIQNADAYANTHQDYESSTATFLIKSDSCHDKKHTKHIHQKSTKARTCVYCKGNHTSSDCEKVKFHEDRIRIVKRDRLCFNCLGKHKIANCNSKFKCRKCARRHHTSLCTGISTRGTFKELRTSEKRRPVRHSAKTVQNGPVLLKTAVTTVQSPSTMAASNILFDEGAQCSFVTEKMAKKLLITSTDKETLCISGFGDKERRVQQLDSATLYLQAEHENIPIKVLIVPEISKPIKTYRCQVGKLDYLTDLNLAHPATAKEDFEIEILVGADHYWDVVQENVVRGKGPTAVQSKVGYLLSGPLSIDACTKEMETPLRKAAIHISTSRIKEDNDIDTNMKYEMVIKRSGSKSPVRTQLCSRWRNERFHKSYGKYGDSDFVSDEIHFQDDVFRRGHPSCESQIQTRRHNTTHSEAISDRGTVTLEH